MFVERSSALRKIERQDPPQGFPHTDSCKHRPGSVRAVGPGSGESRKGSPPRPPHTHRLPQKPLTVGAWVGDPGEPEGGQR